jgi:hypothetical protein
MLLHHHDFYMKSRDNLNMGGGDIEKELSKIRMSTCVLSVERHHASVTPLDFWGGGEQNSDFERSRSTHMQDARLKLYRIIL